MYRLSRGVVILIDEFDGIPQTVVSDFLYTLRQIYLSDEMHCPHSVGNRRCQEYRRSLITIGLFRRSISKMSLNYRTSRLSRYKNFFNSTLTKSDKPSFQRSLNPFINRLPGNRSSSIGLPKYSQWSWTFQRPSRLL